MILISVDNEKIATLDLFLCHLYLPLQCISWTSHLTHRHQPVQVPETGGPKRVGACGVYSTWKQLLNQ